MNTSKLLQTLLRNASLGAVAVTAVGISADAVAQIASTKHNLSTSGTGVNKSTGTEICAFCHTPHGADTSAPVPLWNRTLGSQGAAYTTYATLGTATLDGNVADTGSVSLACLSCHDGTQAMDTMKNAPGSGTAKAEAYTWSGANQTAGKIAAGIITNIGTDLKNDHPIGITYCGGNSNYLTNKDAPKAGIADGTRATGCVDADFQIFSKTTAGYYVESGDVAGRDKSDMILYTRSGEADTPRVECASCHDPHVATKATTEVAFLRTSQAGSGVCLACHVK